MFFLRQRVIFGRVFNVGILHLKLEKSKVPSFFLSEWSICVRVLCIKCLGTCLLVTYVDAHLYLGILLLMVISKRLRVNQHNNHGSLVCSSFSKV